MNPPKTHRILFIDDSPTGHAEFRKVLRPGRAPVGVKPADQHPVDDAFISCPVAPAYDIDSAMSAEEGVRMVAAATRAARPYDMAFVDMCKPSTSDGVRTVQEIWKHDPHLQVVICTRFGECAWEEILNRLGATDRLFILRKPFDSAEVCQLACALTEKRDLARRASLKMKDLDRMVREQVKELEASENRYKLAAAGANDGLWDWDLIAGTIYFSPRWQSMLGFGDAELPSSPRSWFDRVHPDDLAGLQTALAAHLDGSRAHFQAEYRVQTKSGEYRWMLCRGIAVRDKSGRSLRAAGSQTDITDRKAAEERLRHHAFHDTLTGLANRTLLIERIGRCIAMAARNPGYKFAVLYMDLDRFKIINDSLGHMAGDELLMGVSRRLIACVRTLDTVGRVEEDSVARVGGDEFVLLLDDVRDLPAAIGVAERVQKALGEPFTLAGHEVFTSVSIGIAMSNLAYARPEEILRDADTALYRAKANGKSRCEVFDRRMHAQAMARLQLESELRRAIDRQEFRLQYQPVISLGDGRIVGFEALVRWDHPCGDTLPPFDFISIAEETGLIVPLGSWVTREACRQLQRWQAEFTNLPQLSIRINVSIQQFAVPGMVETIRAILHETRLNPTQVKLEITETDVMGNAAATIRGLLELKELNVQLHLDDFGTGYSSLSHLQRLPVDALKIDKSFTANLATDPESMAIVEAIIALAKSLDLAVVAEGVETQEQLQGLLQIGCDFAQGFLFSVPLDEPNVRALLASGKSWPMDGYRLAA